MIPQGTRVRTAAGVYFATMDYAQIDIGKTYVDVLAQAEVVGAGGNDIPPGVVDTLVDAIPYVAAVENTDTSSGGADVESDDSLTRRIWLSPTTYSCAGPRTLTSSGYVVPVGRGERNRCQPAECCLYGLHLLHADRRQDAE